jgi:2-oxo-4-hydroxy-4-carboxy-5-ureidoimidazoline decarboxylase
MTSLPDLTVLAVPLLDEAAFLRRFGHLFEHSPWVVERAFPLGPFSSGADLMAAFVEVINAADRDDLLDLVRRHPELADKAAIDQGSLTSESASEQAGAGLDRLTPWEYDGFHDLNRAYREKFGFPFVICVRLHNRGGILEALRVRTLGNADELAVALENILLIVHFRLADALRAAPQESPA